MFDTLLMFLWLRIQVSVKPMGAGNIIELLYDKVMFIRNSQEAARQHLSATIPESPDYLEVFDNWIADHGIASLAVVKIGGGIIQDRDLFASSIRAISELSSLGYYPTIVHGGGPQISERLLAVEGKPQFIDGLRVTSLRAVGHIALALSGVNDLLTGDLRRAGIEAVGLSNVFEAEYLDPTKYGEVGSVTAVDTTAIIEVISRRKVPVIGCLAHLATHDRFLHDKFLNVNADDAAAALVRSLHPLKYISFTPPGGVRVNDRIISKITPSIANDLQAASLLSIGMLKKVNEALSLIQSHDVTEVVIVHPQHLMDELFTKKGHGTIITGIDN